MKICGKAVSGLMRDKSPPFLTPRASGKKRARMQNNTISVFITSHRAGCAPKKVGNYENLMLDIFYSVPVTTTHVPGCSASHVV